ncbi:acetyl esterase family enzyme [Lachnospiraceae bacterium KM106-2]|nr:acetyl esterase family enzyme [Lachnospiraceae bacterium KM106-2]
MITKRITISEERDVTLTAYLFEGGWEFPNILKRPAVLILPGGGYQYCSDREADPVAFAYLKAGYQAIILRYSVNDNAVWPNQLNDYEQAMELIKEHADEWNIFTDKIVVVGFSAGGHLAACAATMAKNRPVAAVLGYPVIKGDCAKSYCPTAPDVIEAVDRNTCPCFVFATRTDNVVPIQNTLDMMQALNRYDIAFESHIYGYGSHGSSIATSEVRAQGVEICSRIPQWVDNSIEWLKDMIGDFDKKAMSQPVCNRYANPNRAPYLSVDCTIGYLMELEESASVLRPVLDSIWSPMSYEDMAGNIDNMKLKEILGYSGRDEDIVRLDQKLCLIPNSKVN